MLAVLCPNSLQLSIKYKLSINTPSYSTPNIPSTKLTIIGIFEFRLYKNSFLLTVSHLDVLLFLFVINSRNVILYKTNKLNDDNNNIFSDFKFSFQFYSTSTIFHYFRSQFMTESRSDLLLYFRHCFNEDCTSTSYQNVLDG